MRAWRRSAAGSAWARRSPAADGGAGSRPKWRTRRAAIQQGRCGGRGGAMQRHRIWRETAARTSLLAAVSSVAALCRGHRSAGAALEWRLRADNARAWRRSAAGSAWVQRSRAAGGGAGSRPKWRTRRAAIRRGGGPAQRCRIQWRLGQIRRIPAGNGVSLCYFFLCKASRRHSCLLSDFGCHTAAATSEMHVATTVLSHHTRHRPPRRGRRARREPPPQRHRREGGRVFAGSAAPESATRGHRRGELEVADGWRMRAGGGESNRGGRRRHGGQALSWI